MTSMEPLTWKVRGVTVGICLCIFVALTIPALRDGEGLDSSILLSYLPVPLLVAGALVLRRALGWRSFVRETFLVAGLKFGLSATLLVLYWALVPPAPREAAVAPQGRARYDLATVADPAVPVVDIGLADGRMAPSTVRLKPGEAVRLRSLDGRLHTFHVVDARGETLFNVPVLASGATRTVSPRRLPATARCEVHPEERAQILSVPVE